MSLAKKQIDQLANFIMAEVPGEPSQSEGAVDTAIRWMRCALADQAAQHPGLAVLEQIAPKWLIDCPCGGVKIARAALAAVTPVAKEEHNESASALNGPSDVNPMTTTDAATRLAGVRVPQICSCGCHARSSIHNNVCLCPNSLVYLFPETVREWCDHRHYGLMATRTQHKCAYCGDFTVGDEPIFMTSKGHGPRCRCQGRGWTASRDGWSWWRVVHGGDGWIRLTGLLCNTRYHAEVLLSGMVEIAQAWDDNPETALFVALAAAVDKIPGVQWSE